MSYTSIKSLPYNSSRIATGGLRLLGKKDNSSSEPLISIVTPVLNGEKYLEKTIQSVLSQTYKNIEYIIIDGGSTDRSLEIIKKYESRIDYWVSEPDEGISDAFNKGIRLSSGYYIGIVNSDDWYEPNAVRYILEHGDDKDIIYGLEKYWRNDSYTLKNGYPYKLLNFGMCISHPTVFMKQSAYKKIGLFSTAYKVALDYDLMARAYINNLSFKRLDKEPITNFRYGGISKRMLHVGELEEKQIQEDILGVPRYLSNMLYYFRKFARRVGFLRISPFLSTLINPK